MPALYERLFDPLPIVIAYAEEALSNFIQEMETAHLGIYYDKLMERLVELLESESASLLVKEGAITALS